MFLASCVSGVLLAEFFSGDVEQLPLSEAESDQRTPVAPAAHLDHVLQPIAVEPRLIGDQDLIALALLELIQRQKAVLVAAVLHEFIKAAVREQLHVRALQLIAAGDQRLGRAVNGKVKGYAADHPAREFRSGLERGVSDRGDKRQIRPDAEKQRFVEALLKLPPQVLCALRHRFEPPLERPAKSGLHVHARIDAAFFNIVDDHAPILLQIGDLRDVQREKDRKHKRHVRV